MAVDPAVAARFIRERQHQRQASLAALEARARGDARRIIDWIIRTWQPGEVWQWGSLTRPGQFREWSDIDIAVSGLAGPLDGLRMAETAATMTSFPVDLVELDRIDPRHAKTIRSEGIQLYDRQNGR
jgi:predicted nucleotidyltransferase